MKSKFTILLFTIFSTTVLVLVIIYNKTQSQSYISTHYSNNKIKQQQHFFTWFMWWRTLRNVYGQTSVK